MVTEKPRACNSLAKDAETIPLPKEEVTPPVTKIYFAVATSLNLIFAQKRKFFANKIFQGAS